MTANDILKNRESLERFNDDSTVLPARYEQPELQELGRLEKVQAGSWPGYPDGWRGYYDRY